MMRMTVRMATAAAAVSLAAVLMMMLLLGLGRFDLFKLILQFLAELLVRKPMGLLARSVAVGNHLTSGAPEKGYNRCVLVRGYFDPNLLLSPLNSDFSGNYCNVFDMMHSNL